MCGWEAGPITVIAEQKYLTRFERYVVDVLYRNVPQLLVNNPLHLQPVFDAICAGDDHTAWVTTDDELVRTMRSAPPAFASMLRSNSLSVFITGDIWRDYLTERSPGNLAFIENVVQYAEQYQEERGRRPVRPNVFISYSHHDRFLATALQRRLEKNGAEVWLDEKIMPFGSSISSSCEAGIRRSAKVVFFITPESLRSDWVRFEFRTAVAVSTELNRKRLIIPTVANVDHQTLIAALPEVRNTKYLVLDATLRDIGDDVIANILQ
jgi:hypothetical protein